MPLTPALSPEYRGEGDMPHKHQKTHTAGRASSGTREIRRLNLGASAARPQPPSRRKHTLVIRNRGFSESHPGRGTTCSRPF